MTTAEYRRCATCGATMHETIWLSHVRSKQHRDETRNREVTPLKFARSLLILAAAFVVFGWITYLAGGDAWPYVYIGTIALVGGILVGKR